MKQYYLQTGESIREGLTRHHSATSSQGFFNGDNNNMYSGRADEACKTLIDDLQKGMQDLRHLKTTAGTENFDPNLH